MTKFLNNPIIAALLLALVAAISFLVLSLAGRSTMNRIEWKETTYRVQAGDSLWAISGEYCPDEVDRRDWIAEIRELNGMDDSVIHPGQKLTVLEVKEG